MTTPRACCPGQTHVPSRAELREALVRAAAAGKRREWWAALQAERAFTRQQAEKTQGRLPGTEESQ